MTHKTAMNGNHLGMPVPSCDGELAIVTTANADSDIFKGQERRRTIDVYRCTACGQRVVLARTLDADGVAGDERELVNAYAVPEVRDMVRGLVEHATDWPHARTDGQ